MKNLPLKIFTVIFLSLLNGINLLSQTITIDQGGSVSTCSGTFYDSGGSGSNFSGIENNTMTLCPTGGTCISLNFTQFDLGLLTGATLNIYNGSSTSAPLIGTYTGSTSPGTISANLAGNGCLTLEFSSFSLFGGAPGWTANISCVTCTAGPPPSVQDCGGAIPICQNVYSTTASYSGEGNITGEISSGISCLGSGELNDVWYTFTVTQSGNLNFTITPNNLSDDYDWAVYNLTNNVCADIANNAGIEVSCNFSGTSGTTGANGGSGLSSQDAAGTPDNAVIPVVAGQTYVINVSNFSSSQNGYTIDFSSSTATIFDNVAPTLQQVFPVACNSSSIAIKFSENILCNTVQAADFTLSGPGGPYSITAASSPVCISGGQYDVIYDIVVSPAITTSGTYTLCLVGGSGSVTDLCGNVALASSTSCLTFSVTCSTTVGVTAGGGTICGGGCTNVSAAANGGTAPFTFSWSPNIGNGPGPFSVCPTSSTIYTVTITDNLGNTSTDTANVFVNTTPVAFAGNDTIVCSGSAVILNASGGSAYQWSGGPASANFPVIVTNTTTYTVTVFNGACSSQDQITVTTTPGLIVNLSPTDVTCFGLNNGSIVSNVNGGAQPYTYVWSTSPPQNGPIATNVGAGNYSLVVTDQLNCNSTQTVTVNEPSAINLSFTGTTDLCAGQSTSLTVNATGGTSPYSFNWSAGLGVGPTQSVNPTGSITYTVIVSDNNSCTNFIEIPINVSPIPLADFSAPDSGCVPLAVAFTNLSTNATNYTWYFSDGTSSTSVNPIHVFSTPGFFTVSLSASNGSCSDSISKSNFVIVYPQSIASIFAYPSSASELEPIIPFTNQSVNASNCIVYFGDGDSLLSCVNSFEHSYMSSGNYIVTLITETENGCNDTSRTEVSIVPETTIYVPNAFTPNDDGLNDVFFVKGLNIKEFQLFIFNRWGEEVFSSNEIDTGWNGTVNGKLVQQDTYVYKIKAKDYSSKKINLSGQINLIR